MVGRISEHEIRSPTGAYLHMITLESIFEGDYDADSLQYVARDIVVALNSLLPDQLSGNFRVTIVRRYDDVALDTAPRRA